MGTAKSSVKTPGLTLNVQASASWVYFVSLLSSTWMGRDLIWSSKTAVEMWQCSQLVGTGLGTKRYTVNVSCTVGTYLLGTGQKPGFSPLGHLSPKALSSTALKLVSHGLEVSVALF